MRRQSSYLILQQSVSKCPAIALKLHHVTADRSICHCQRFGSDGWRYNFRKIFHLTGTFCLDHTTLTVHTSPDIQSIHFPFKGLKSKNIPTKTQRTRGKADVYPINFFPRVSEWRLCNYRWWQLGRKRWWWHSTAILYQTLKVKCRFRGNKLRQSQQMTAG